MRKFDAETATATVELEQMVADYWREIDLNDGRNAAAFFTEDCKADFGAISFTGRDGVTRYYAERAARMRAEEPSGVRTTRHIYYNLHIAFDGPQRATISFLIASFAGSGSPPVFGGCVPMAISDSRFECRRLPDGTWRIFAFHGTPLFVNDPYAKKSLIGGDSHD